MCEFCEQLEYLAEKRIRQSLKDQGAQLPLHEVEAFAKDELRKMAAMVFVLKYGPEKTNA